MGTSKKNKQKMNRLLLLGILLVLQVDGGGVNALQKWDAEEDSSSGGSGGGWFSGMKETMGNAADSAKKYYDEHARERVSAYATQAADIAKQAAAKAKETSKGAKEYAAGAAEGMAGAAKECYTSTAEKAKEYGSAAASAAKEAASATADAAAKAAAAAKDATQPDVLHAKVKDAAVAAADAAKAAASATAGAAATAAAAAREAANSLGEQIKALQDTDMTELSGNLGSFAQQVKQSMETLAKEFGAGNPGSDGGDGGDGGAKHNTDDGANDKDNVQKNQQQQQNQERDGSSSAVEVGGQRCPYKTQRRLETVFADQAVAVLKAKNCASLTEMTKSMYANLLSTGAASCDGIYALLDEFNGKLPSRKVALCAEDVVAPNEEFSS